MIQGVEALLFSPGPRCSIQLNRLIFVPVWLLHIIFSPQCNFHYVWCVPHTSHIVRHRKFSLNQDAVCNSHIAHILHCRAWRTRCFFFFTSLRYTSRLTFPGKALCIAVIVRSLGKYRLFGACIRLSNEGNLKT